MADRSRTLRSLALVGAALLALALAACLRPAAAPVVETPAAQQPAAQDGAAESRLPELAAELVRLKVDLIVTTGAPPSAAAHAEAGAVVIRRLFHERAQEYR